MMGRKKSEVKKEYKSVLLDAEVHKRLKELSVALDIPIKEVVVEALKSYEEKIKR
jgi:predicted transcriptional regulator